MPDLSFFAILSDIHGNIDALDAVIADLQHWPVSGMLCLGDIIGYGPAPAECVQRVMDMCTVSVFGNHEAMLSFAEKVPPTEWRQSVGKPIELAIQQLSQEQTTWLRSLPIVIDLDPITISHATLNAPDAFVYMSNTGDAEDHFAAQSTAIHFHGHTHLPAIWEQDQKGIRCHVPGEDPVRLDGTKRYSINVGSVGQPRDLDPRASYVLYDFRNRLLLHRRVSYDIARAQERFREAGLPQPNASRIAAGR